ncbi:MAG: hypothetical protein QOF83_2860 [Solirubrobacteraceae bacterium]|jgi:hypothetical protein|nr:hypothetical protein [Solirubrobacteraceae bacterium]
MSNLLRRRPSGAMIVAVMALIMAASGTAIAASKLVSGDKLIKRGSLSGSRLRKHTITGTQVNLPKLGKVPNAKQADKIGTVYYRSASFTAFPTSRVTASADCPAGTFVTGGGVTSPDETTYGSGSDKTIDSYPASTKAGWRVTMENRSNAKLVEKVWAICVPASSTG